MFSPSFRGASEASDPGIHNHEQCDHGQTGRMDSGTRPSGSAGMTTGETQGGLPIIIEGELIGAIGVSGVKSFEDEQIAMDAIKAVFPQAKIAWTGEENDG
jgi:uncharacterized protein GlcG (DUF336 family)